MEKQWKYAKEAHKVRYCVECKELLEKWEVLVCGPCFEALVYNIVPEYELEKLRDEDDEEVDDESD